jgi:hypothetical protein
MLKTLKSKINQATRLLLVNSLTTKNDSILIVEYPKSGGTWLGQLISNYLEIPFPRNKMPSLKRSVFHSHYLPQNNITKNKKIVYLVRDGRDVLISLYYHQLVWSNKNKLNPKDVIYHRKQLKFDDYDDVKSNISTFMQYSYKETPSKLQQFTYMGNWYTYNKAWLEEFNRDQNNIYLVKYEDLLEDTKGTMAKMLETFFNVKTDYDRLEQVVDKFSFENQTKRKKGEENKNSFLRKGIVGDWKNYFGTKENEEFKSFTKDLLIKLNYEKDSNW